MGRSHGTSTSGPPGVEMQMADMVAGNWVMARFRFGAVKGRNIPRP